MTAVIQPDLLGTPESGTTPPASTARPRQGTRRRLHIDEIVSIVVLGFIMLAALIPGVLAPYGPLAVDPTVAFQPPSASHPFGTDESGRDIFSRVIYGTRSSLLIGLVATMIGVGVALVLGTLAGAGNRVVDFVISRFIEVLFAFPSLLLALVAIAIMGPGVVTTTIAVGLSTAPGYARIIRTQVQSVRLSGYVEAAVVSGKGRGFILRRHVLPNVGAPLFALVTLGLGQAIVWASALSFLGLGATPPNPEWGAMLAAGRDYVGNAWWLTVFPGLFIVLTAAASTLLGRSIQNRFQER